MPDGGFDACETDRDLATETWDVLLGPNALFDDEPPAEVSVTYGPAEGLEAERAALEATGALETLAAEAAATHALFEPLAIEARACGEPSAFHDAENRAVVVCYELVAGLLALRAAGEGDGANDDSAGAGTDDPSNDAPGEGGTDEGGPDGDGTDGDGAPDANGALSQ